MYQSPARFFLGLEGLRDKIYHLIKYKVGNGRDIFMCHDNWHPPSPIINHLGNRSLYNSVVQLNVKLECFIQEILEMARQLFEILENTSHDEVFNWRIS